MKRRGFLGGALALGLACACGRSGSDEAWCWADLETLSQALARRQLSSTDLAAACLQRIQQLNPRLRAVIEVNERPEAPSTRHRLAGIPVLLKDNLATTDSLSTTAGSAALLGCRPGLEAECVTRLRRAGMLVLGKANMSEWGNLRARHCLSGWSARGGQGRNPHALDRSPGGSSSGCAAAVAAGLVPVAVGTETFGSITCPASMCGVVGLKPTPEVVSLQGMIPIAPSFDCIGPMGRSVADVAALLEVLASQSVDYLSGLRRGALRGARLGVARREWGLHGGVDRLMEQQLSVLSRLGAQLVDPVPFPKFPPVALDFARVLSYEFKHGLNAYLAAGTGGPARSLAEVIRYNAEHAVEEGLAFLDQEMLQEAERCGGLEHPEYRRSLSRIRRQVEQPVAALFARLNLQAIVAPTCGPAWLIDFTQGERLNGQTIAAPAMARCPHLSLPAGQVHGLPVGLSFYGPRFSEARLLAMAYDYEQETHAFRRPALVDTLPGPDAPQ